MYDVILYAAIATIVCAVLYSVLGKSVGQGPESGIEPLSFSGENKNSEPVVLEPEFNDGGIPALAAIRAADKNFSPHFFIDGAKGAYSMILEAFAEGDRDFLKTMLTPDVFAVYDEAISDREAKDLTQITDLARIKSAEIVDAELEGKRAKVSVEFNSELSSALVDADGQAVSGDPDLLNDIREVWVFERLLSAKEPDWSLSDVLPSEGDEVEADPTPDTKA